MDAVSIIASVSALMQMIGSCIEISRYIGEQRHVASLSEELEKFAGLGEILRRPPNLLPCNIRNQVSDFEEILAAASNASQSMYDTLERNLPPPSRESFCTAAILFCCAMAGKQTLKKENERQQKDWIWMAGGAAFLLGYTLTSDSTQAMLIWVPWVLVLGTIAQDVGTVLMRLRRAWSSSKASKGRTREPLLAAQLEELARKPSAIAKVNGYFQDDEDTIHSYSAGDNRPNIDSAIAHTGVPAWQ